MHKHLIIVFLFAFIFPILASSTTTNLSVAMILWRGKTAAEKGFEEELSKLGYKVQLTVYNSEQSYDKLQTVLKNLQMTRFDYIYTFGTTVTKATKHVLKNKKPLIFNIVTFPVKSGIVKKMNGSGENITGVSNYIPLKKQFMGALQFFPIKKVGLIFNSREDNSIKQREEILKLEKFFGFKLKDYRVAGHTNRLNNILRNLKKGDVDIMYLPSDSYVISKSLEISETLKRLKIPSISHVKELITKGILMGVVSDYYSFGQEAAKIIHSIQQGKKISEIPIVTADKSSMNILINKKTFETLNLTVEDNMQDHIKFFDNSK